MIPIFPNTVIKYILNLSIDIERDIYNLTFIVSKLTLICKEWNEKIIPTLKTSLDINFDRTLDKKIQLKRCTNILARYNIYFKINLDSDTEIQPTFIERVESFLVYNSNIPMISNIDRLYPNLKEIIVNLSNKKAQFPILENIKYHLNCTSPNVPLIDSEESIEFIFGQNNFYKISVCWVKLEFNPPLQISTQLTVLKLSNCHINSDLLCQILEKSQNLQQIELTHLINESFDKALEVSIQFFHFRRLVCEDGVFSLLDIWSDKSNLKEININDRLPIDKYIKEMVSLDNLIVEYSIQPTLNFLEESIQLNVPHLTHLTIQTILTNSNVLLQNHYITTLSFEKLGFNSLIAIAKLNHPTITTLEIGEFQLDGNLEDLQLHIQNNYTIKQLLIYSFVNWNFRPGVSKNDIPLTFITEILRVNRTLVSLVLIISSINEPNCKEFDQVLSNNNVLKNLFVSRYSKLDLNLLPICNKYNINFNPNLHDLRFQKLIK
ncbi:hypothetical protein DLAC_04512 [Tieghemostelium lacteum]|uniref:F-box domain-containing protein n=1 Tax=Tieghemostelium lacteum TaxID=361077 RepID=A0A151ZJW3_TIELA|nr:hypothetical protein DLAC_04512 [Tieghemostelium lacteum]|eukprot:KYQ94217.1 hypothetical protein DLAC_04512 [Tieghemostelium lacteum]